MSKIRVAVLFGGRSTEHQISLLSAQNIIKSLDREKYEPVLIGIDKAGRWYYQQDSIQVLHGSDPKKIELTGIDTEILFSQNTNDHYITSVNAIDREPLSGIDVIFPVLHGTYGEDGAIQGLAKVANLPCVGPGILGSAVGMDKEIMKRLLRDGGIASAKWVTLRRRDIPNIDIDAIVDELGTELFVKPVNLGSSVGISFVRRKVDLQAAIMLAFQYDNKVLIEERVIGREIECAVLGNDDPIASIPGEVIPKDGFYSFEAKYVDEQGAKLAIPADLTEEQIEAVKKLSIETFVQLECSGMARVDMFLTEDDRLLINEINTLPGFTNISMYPTLWKISGISNLELIDRLIQLAIEEYERDNELKRQI